MKLFSVHVNTDFGQMYLRFSKEMRTMSDREQVNILDLGLGEIQSYLQTSPSDNKYIWIDSSGYIAPRVMTEVEALQTTYIHRYKELSW